MSKLLIGVAVAAGLALTQPARADNSPFKVVFTRDAPPPVAPYNQATIHGDLVFLAGQLPITCDAACWAAYDALPNNGEQWKTASTLVTLVAKDAAYTPAITNSTSSSDPNVVDQTTKQAKQVMDNLEAVLNSVGLSFDNVVKCNVYLVQPVNGTAFNTVYESYFGEKRPARAAVNIAGLALGARIEVECLAVK